MAVTEVEGTAPAPATTAGSAGGSNNPAPAPTPRTPSTGFGRRVADAVARNRPSIEDAVRDTAASAPPTDTEADAPAEDSPPPTGSGSTDSDAPAPTSGGTDADADAAPGDPAPLVDEVGTEEGAAAPATPTGTPAATSTEGSVTSESAIILRTDEYESRRREEIAALEAKQERLAELASSGGKVFGLDLGTVASTALEDVEDQIDANRALAVMSELAYATGGDSALTAALDGATEVQIEVKDETEMGSDAHYDADEDVVAMSDSMVEDVLGYAEAAVAAGLLNADMRLNVDQIEEVDASTTINNIRKAADLIGGHEFVHAAQDTTGKLDEINAYLASEVEKLDASVEGLPEDEAAAILAEGFTRLEKWRINEAEYDAYMRQETGQLSDDETREAIGFTGENLTGQTQAGVATSVYLTTRPDGTLFPREEAVDRIFNMEVYGTPEPTDEQLEAGYTIDPAALADAEAEGRRFPGRRFPGRRFPGEVIEDGTARAMVAFPEDIVRSALGQAESPGRRFPGRRFPGSVF